MNHAITKIHPVALGVALGIIEGLPIFLGTIILMWQGESGPAFLSKLFPFYEISWTGAFIGLVEGFIDGFVGGVIMAWIYNKISTRNISRKS
jgi:hypothetical protein